MVIDRDQLCHALPQKRHVGLTFQGPAMKLVTYSEIMACHIVRSIHYLCLI